MRKRILRFKRLHALAEQKEARARMNMLLAKKELQKEQTLLQQVQGYVQDYQSILKPNQELSTIRFAELGLFLNQLNTMLLEQLLLTIQGDGVNMAAKKDGRKKFGQVLCIFAGRTREILNAPRTVSNR